MGASIAETRIAKKKANSTPAKPRQEKTSPHARPDVRSSFGAIYKRDRFTLEAAVKAFLKS